MSRVPRSGARSRIQRAAGVLSHACRRCRMEIYREEVEARYRGALTYFHRRCAEAWGLAGARATEEA